MVDQETQRETDINAVFRRHHQEILQELHQAFLAQNTSLAEGVNYDTLLKIYGQMQYHLGWVDQQLRPADGHPGKLLRPKLLLLSYELAWAQGQAPQQIPLHSLCDRLCPQLPR